MKLTENKLKNLIEQVLKETQQLESVIEFLEGLEVLISQGNIKTHQHSEYALLGSNAGYAGSGSLAKLSSLMPRIINTINVNLGGEDDGSGVVGAKDLHIQISQILLPEEVYGWPQYKKYSNADEMGIRTLEMRLYIPLAPDGGYEGNMGFTFGEESYGGMGVKEIELIRLTNVQQYDFDLIYEILELSDPSKATQLLEFVRDLSAHDELPIYQTAEL